VKTSGKAPRSKARTRKGGSAIPLDETDKRLMNLLQSNFPLDPEPFALVAGEADLELEDVLGRTRRLLENRIIREITPIFDTRALGYESMLVAAKVDSEHPQRAAQLVNAHPGVSHNYLRTHDFNLWFTIATPPDSKLGLKGTIEALMAETGAVSMRELPTLTLFKINMNLEMEGGTDALAAQVEAAPPRELEAQPYDDQDIAIIKALQGPMEAIERPYDAAAREARSEIVVAHVRDASVGAIDPRNTHPFQHGRWLFAHNGTVARFRRVAGVRRAIEAEIAPAYRALLSGTTDSERCFYLFLTLLDARATPAAPPALEDVQRALAATVALVGRLADRRHQPAAGRLLGNARAPHPDRHHRCARGAEPAGQLQGGIHDAGSGVRRERQRDDPFHPVDQHQSGASRVQSGGERGLARLPGLAAVIMSGHDRDPIRVVRGSPVE
jgi:DNA-binding Lrp family transcriptional regulator